VRKLRYISRSTFFGIDTRLLTTTVRITQRRRYYSSWRVRNTLPNNTQSRTTDAHKHSEIYGHPSFAREQHSKVSQLARACRMRQPRGPQEPFLRDLRRGGPDTQTRDSHTIARSPFLWRSQQYLVGLVT